MKQFALFILLFFPMIANAQLTTFQERIIGGCDDDGLHYIHKASDSTYYLVGYSHSDSCQDKTSPESYHWRGTWILQVDADFNILWDKTIAEGGRDYGSSMATSDGGLLIGGRQEIWGSAYGKWVRKFDRNGDVVWDSVYEYESDMSWGASSMVSGYHGEVVHADMGRVWVSGLPYNRWDFQIAAYDSVGKELWRKKYGDGNASTELGSVIKDHQGGYWAVTQFGRDFSGDQTDTTRNSRNIWVLKLDSLGNKLWDKTYGGDDEEVFNDAKAMPDGSLIIVADSRSGISDDRTQANLGNVTNQQRDTWMLKIDSLGDLKWDKALTRAGSSDIYSRNNQVEVLRDSNILFLSEGNMRLLDQSGEMLYELGYQEVTCLYEEDTMMIMGGTRYKLCAETDWMIKKARLPKHGVSVKLGASLGSACQYDLGINMPTRVMHTDEVLLNSREEGNYIFYTDSSVLDIKTIVPEYLEPLMKSSQCVDSTLQLSLSPSQTTSEVTYLHKMESWPLTSLHMGTLPKSPCDRSRTHLNITNHGFATQGAFDLTVAYPSGITPLRSIPMWDSQEGNVLTYHIDSIPGQGHLVFSINDQVDCQPSELVGNVLTIDAKINTQFAGDQLTNDWDSSMIDIGYKCMDDGVDVWVKNVGSGDMSDSASVNLFAAGYPFAELRYKLNTGDSSRVFIYTDEVPLMVSALTTPGSIQGPRVESLMTRCISDQSLRDTSLHYSLSTGRRETARVFVPILSSKPDWDINTQIFPEGIGEDHIIEKGQRIYVSHQYDRGNRNGYSWQNSILIRDTLSDQVDMSTLQMEYTSDSAIYRIYGKGKTIFEVRLFSPSMVNRNDPLEESNYFMYSYRLKEEADTATVSKWKPGACVNKSEFTPHTFQLVDELPQYPQTIDIWPCREPMGGIISRDTLIYDQDSLEILSEVLSPHSKGRWILHGDLLEADDIHSPKLKVRQLQLGLNYLTWEVKSCDQILRETIVIELCNAPSPAKILPTPEYHCIDDPLRLSAADVDHGADKWEILKGNGLLVGRFTNELQVDRLEVGEYSFRWSIISCDSLVADTVNITVEPSVEASFEIGNDGYTLIANSAPNYQWYFEGEKLEGETAQTLIAREVGFYEVETSNNACSAKSGRTNVTTGESDEAFDRQIVLYPNPTDGVLHIRNSATHHGAYLVKVIDLSGRMVHKQFYHQPQPDSDLSIDLSGLENGIYFLEIENSQGQRMVRKFTLDK